MALLCAKLEDAYGLPAGSLRFEVQVETPAAVLGAESPSADESEVAAVPVVN